MRLDWGKAYRVRDLHGSFVVERALLEDTRHVSDCLERAGEARKGDDEKGKKFPTASPVLLHIVSLRRM